MQESLMENEFRNFFKVWFTVLASLLYCYAIGKKIPKGITRFLLLFPIICIFLYLPMNLYSMHLCGFTSFFIAWLASFKVLLFSFGKGPLSSQYSELSLPTFLALACLPIKIQEKNPSSKVSPKPKKSPLNYAIKGVFLALIISLQGYNDRIHPKIVMFCYLLHIYFVLEIFLAMLTYLVQAILGFQMEQPFNDPHLTTSVQDFWGRRWNLMASSILRSTVYEPALVVTTRLIGREWASIPAVVVTFFVSGITHELIFYHLGRQSPTWEVTWFFIIHGFWVGFEIALKKKIKQRWRLPGLVSGIFTIVFVSVTGFWLFFPPLLDQCKAGVRSQEEYAAIATFIRNTLRHFSGTTRVRNG